MIFIRPLPHLMVEVWPGAFKGGPLVEADSIEEALEVKVGPTTEFSVRIEQSSDIGDGGRLYRFRADIPLSEVWERIREDERRKDDGDAPSGSDLDGQAPTQ